MKILIKRSRLLPLIAALFMMSGTIQAQVFVKADASGANDGSSWANAFTDLQVGIDSAGNAGSQLWIANGTYYPTSGTDRSTTFSITKTIEVYGGFAGTETSIDERDLSQNQTILSGDIGAAGADADNVYIVLTCLGNTFGPVVLDGLILEDGHNDLPNGTGGGLLFRFTELTIKNCTFRNNFATWGAGAYSFQGDGTRVISSGFYNNTAANRGGGVLLEGSNTRRSTIVNSIFIGNASENGGGGAMSNSRPMTVRNSTFYDNRTTAGLGGGALLSVASVGDTSYVYNSILWANTAATGPEHAAAGTGTLIGDYNIISGTGIGPNDINSDPLFYVTAHDDLRILNTCSPAINGGDSTLSEAGIVEDFAGLDRVRFGQIDIGAHELGGIEVESTNIKCNGETSGELTFTTTLSETVSFYLDNTFLQDADEESFMLDTLSAGTYQISIAVGCAGNVATNLLIHELVITEPDPLSIDSVLVTDVGCKGESNGAFELKVLTGGTAPFSYSMDDVNYTSSLVYSGLPPGNYDLYVQDTNGCKTSSSVIVDEPDLVSLTLAESKTIRCNNGSNGQITATGSGGVGGFTYSINQGSFQTSNIFDDLVAGKYVIDMKDANGCLAKDSITLAEPAAWTYTTAVSDVLCHGGADGSLDVIASGGVAPYLYSIDGTNFQASSLFDNLAAGAYTILVEDNLECMDEVTVTITEPSQLDLMISNVSDVICSGEENGEIIVIGAGGTSPYQYSIDGVQFQSDTIFSGLDAENFTITVMDANGCTMTKTASVAEPDVLDLDLSDVTNVSCQGEADGAITVVGDGGVTPYEYSIDEVNFQTGAMFSLLDVGTYTLTIRDANGCTLSKDTSISEPNELSMEFSSVVNVSCNNGIDGSITLSATGGTTPYSYSVNEGASQSGNVFEQLGAGSYSVDIMDANGCTFSADTVITEPTALNLSVENLTNLTCNNSADGRIVVEGSGGTSPYVYSLDGVNFQSSGIFEQLVAGDYTAVIKDANECIFPVDTALSEPDPLTLSFATVENVLCNGDSNGSIELSSTGGTAPFEFSIDGIAFQTEAMFDQLGIGTHTFTVVDTNGCTISADTTITEPDVLSISVDQRNSSFTISATGGTAPYEFAVDDGAFQASGSFEGLARGNHTFTVKDANACQVSSEELLVLSAKIEKAEIKMYPNPVVNSLKITSVGGVKVRLLQLDGREILEVEIKNSETEISLEGLKSGLYLVQVRDANNSVLSQQQIVKQ